MSVEVQSAAGGVPPARTISAGGIASGGGDLSTNRTITVTGATQSDQETGTSTAVAVTPGVQHSHPSAAKFWAFVTYSAGAPTVAASYNLTSVTDNAAGDITFNIATDFSSANWAPVATGGYQSAVSFASTFSQTAGNCRMIWVGSTFSTGVDSAQASIAGFGDQ